MRDVPYPANHGSGNFREIVSSFLLQKGLPFSSVLSAERMEWNFRKPGSLFGVNQIDSAALML